MLEYKIEFDKLEWIERDGGIRDKCIDQNGIRVRLVEYSKEMEPHWCTKAHYGMILSGLLRVKFKRSSLTFKTGDIVFLPPGDLHKHKAIVVLDPVQVFFIEPIIK